MDERTAAGLAEIGAISRRAREEAAIAQIKAAIQRAAQPSARDPAANMQVSETSMRTQNND